MTRNQLQPGMYGVLAGLTLVLAAAACGGSSSSPPPSTRAAGTQQATGTTVAGSVSVSTATVSGLGTVLVDTRGRTLYMFEPDKHTRVTCVGSCAAAWPPLKLEAGEKPAASGRAQTSLLGSDRNPEGGKVVTYDGWPLYTYVGDTSTGTANGQAANANGGLWYALAPSGEVIRKPTSGNG